MTPRQLEEAINTLEYLILNHPDPGKVAHYRQELDHCRRQLESLRSRAGKMAPASEK